MTKDREAEIRADARNEMIFSSDEVTELLAELDSTRERIAKLEKDKRLLLEGIIQADVILKEHISQCVNGGPSSCWVCEKSDEWRDHYEMTIHDAASEVEP